MNTYTFHSLTSCQTKRRGRKQTTSAKLLSETGNLLFSLLLSASIMDACIVLKCDDISKQNLECLYEWMMLHRVDARIFEVFALGLQRHGIRLDISLENSFASRALQLSKAANKPDGFDRSGEDNTDEL